MIKTTISKIIKTVYEKVFKINDSPQKIALGLSLGVFAGIFPGTGPLAAIFLALVFKANRATALFGSVITNTWISLVTLLLAIKAGALVFGIQWQALYETWKTLLGEFKWKLLFESSVLKIILPVAIGYILIAFIFGLLTYLLTLLILLVARKNKIN